MAPPLNPRLFWRDLREDKEFFIKLLEKSWLSDEWMCQKMKNSAPMTKGLFFFKVELCVASHIAVMLQC